MANSEFENCIMCLMILCYWSSTILGDHTHGSKSNGLHNDRYIPSLSSSTKPPPYRDEKPSSKKGDVSYDFSYEVRDDDSGLYFAHEESREGKKTEGSYRVKLPDGRTQVVNYVADEDGYRAKVTYENPTSDSPAKASYHGNREKPRHHSYERKRTFNERLSESLEDRRLRENLYKLVNDVDQKTKQPRNETARNRSPKEGTNQNGFPDRSNDSNDDGNLSNFVELQKLTSPLTTFSVHNTKPYFPPIGPQVPDSFFDQPETSGRNSLQKSVNKMIADSMSNLKGPEDQISSYLNYQPNPPLHLRSKDDIQ